MVSRLRSIPLNVRWKVDSTATAALDGEGDGEPDKAREKGEGIGVCGVGLVNRALGDGFGMGVATRGSRIGDKKQSIENRQHGDVRMFGMFKHFSDVYSTRHTPFGLIYSTSCSQKA